MEAVRLRLRVTKLLQVQTGSGHWQLVKHAWLLLSIWVLCRRMVASGLQDIGRANIKARNRHQRGADYGVYDEQLLQASNELSQQAGFAAPFPLVKVPKPSIIDEKFGYAWMDDALLCECIAIACWGREGVIEVCRGWEERWGVGAGAAGLKVGMEHSVQKSHLTGLALPTPASRPCLQTRLVPRQTTTPLRSGA